MQDMSIATNTQDDSIGSGVVSSSSSYVPDWLGIVASVGCAIHCAAMPFVIAFLPMLGLSFLADESFHKVMVAVCAILALLAFVPGWRVHRKWLPAGIAVAGLTIIGAAAFGLEDNCECCTMPENAVPLAADGESEVDVCCEHCAAEASSREAANKEERSQVLAGFAPWITPLGGILLIVAHLFNHRFSCLCGCCPPKPSAA